MWRGLPSELPAGIYDAGHTDDANGTDNARFRERGEYLTSTYPDITTPYYGPQFSVPRKPLTNDSAITRVQRQPQVVTKDVWSSFEEELRNADVELERALVESLNTANTQPRLDHEER
jgi:hypothetical protein